jgi:hypothetical protein
MLARYLLILFVLTAVVLPKYPRSNDAYLKGTAQGAHVVRKQDTANHAKNNAPYIKATAQGAKGHP